MFCVSYRNKPANYAVMHKAIANKVMKGKAKIKTSGDPESWKEFIVRHNKKQTIKAYLHVFGGKWTQRPKYIDLLKLNYQPTTQSDNQP